MEDIKRYMQRIIQFATLTNPIWPFAAMIVDNDGKVLIEATDCAHISPLYHAESLAIHVLATNNINHSFKNLTLICTAECDVLSQSSIHFARVVQEIEIDNIYYGVSLKTINELWPMGIDIPSKMIIDQSQYKDIKLSEGILEKECLDLFQGAMHRQKQLNKPHPAKGTLSKDINDFYKLTVEI